MIYNYLVCGLMIYPYDDQPNSTELTLGHSRPPEAVGITCLQALQSSSPAHASSAAPLPDWRLLGARRVGVAWGEGEGRVRVLGQK